MATTPPTPPNPMDGDDDMPPGDHIGAGEVGEVPVRERLGAFEGALAELRTMVARMPTEQDADRAIRAEDKLNRLLAFALIPTLLVIGLILVNLVSIADTRSDGKVAKDGVRCVLAHLAEHRVVNEGDHDRLQAALEIDDINPSTLLPGRPTNQELEEFCGDFYSTHEISGSR